MYYAATHQAALGDPVMGPILEGRASGGPVSGGTPYIVGEQGPELFVPSNSGSIVPNGAMGGQTVIHVNVSPEVLRTAPQAEMNGSLFGEQIKMRLREAG
jgi:phage-related minor tail protein